MMYWKCKTEQKKSTMEATIIDENEASSEDGKRSPAPNSVAKITRRYHRRYLGGMGAPWEALEAWAHP